MLDTYKNIFAFEPIPMYEPQRTPLESLCVELWDCIEEAYPKIWSPGDKTYENLKTKMKEFKLL